MSAAISPRAVAQAVREGDIRSNESSMFFAPLVS